MIRIKKSELQEMIKRVAKEQLTSKGKKAAPLAEGAGDFMSRRELLHKTRELSFKFENDVIKILELEDPNTMPLEKRTEFLRIMRAMEKNMVDAVAKAIIEINKANIPTKAEEVELPAAPAPEPVPVTAETNSGGVPIGSTPMAVKGTRK